MTTRRDMILQFLVDCSISERILGLKRSTRPSPIKQALKRAESRLSLNEGLSKFGSASQVRSGWGGTVGGWEGESDRSSGCLSTLLNSYTAAVFKQHGSRGSKTATSHRRSAAGPEKGVWLPAPHFPAHFPGQWRTEALFSPWAIHLTQTPAGQWGRRGEGGQSLTSSQVKT